MLRATLVFLAMLAAAADARALAARERGPDPCERPAIGGPVPEPADLRSHNGTLSVELRFLSRRLADGSVRYCYLTPQGEQSPTLRMHPGDLLVLKLSNELSGPASATDAYRPASDAARRVTDHSDPCNDATMAPTSTNLHFHGLTVPPRCHEDDVLKTSIQPGMPPFEYRFRIPADEPPGLYWYHPHIHGHTAAQVFGGASGALIVEGIERANPDLAGLPERVLVIRDQNLLNPDAPPSRSEPIVPKMLIDRDGDAANNGTGYGKPAKDLSINYVPVPYPDYPPASIAMKPNERQLWRVVNAAGITYLNLALIVDHVPQRLGIVGIDGVPLISNGKADNAIEWRDHVGLPPGSRAEFIVTGPPAGVPALLVTRAIDTGQGGENDPNRALATVSARSDASEPRSSLPGSPQPLAARARPWLGDVAPVRMRKLYFSEKLSDPSDPRSATEFYLTVDGQTPKAFDPSSTEPNITVRQGDVEDWIIENRSSELHAFHIHQIHFLLLDWSGVPVNEPFLRDTVNVPFFNGRALAYPSVRLRMDFRDPDAIGTFVYHCHLLDHEDGGMMGVIRVLPADAAPRIGARAQRKPAPHRL